MTTEILTDSDRNGELELSKVFSTAGVPPTGYTDEEFEDETARTAEDDGTSVGRKPDGSVQYSDDFEDDSEDEHCLDRKVQGSMMSAARESVLHEAEAAHSSGAHDGDGMGVGSVPGYTPRPADSDGRLSPRTLQAQMYAHLNHNYVLEESLQHLEAVARARDVALAQQESATLTRLVKQRDEKDARKAQDEAAAEKATALLEAQRRDLAEKVAEVEQQRRNLEWER